jgi:hypothetical protein
MPSGTFAATAGAECSYCNVGTWSTMVGASANSVCIACNAGLRLFGFGLVFNGGGGDDDDDDDDDDGDDDDDQEKSK